MLRLRSRWSLFTLGTLAALAACDTPSAPVVATRAPQAPRAVVIPAQGSSTTLDIGNWNLEWFGDPANGPTNDALQLSNARDVIAGADLDVWGLVEIVDTTEWKSLKSISGYTGVLANDASVTSGSTYYTQSEQKPALLWKTSVASLASAKVILTGNDSDFAGRPPLEVKLHVTLNGTTEDVVFIVLHMKAFNDVTSWQRRQNASNALKSYLDTTYPTQKVIVVGDWNDDVDTSITAGQPSPYAAFVSLISSLPSGSPCALLVSARFGLPKPMIVRTTMSDGRAVSAFAASIAASIAARSLMSATCCTCQPYASNRIPASSVYVSSVGPSIVMWLSS